MASCPFGYGKAGVAASTDAPTSSAAPAAQPAASGLAPLLPGETDVFRQASLDKVQAEGAVYYSTYLQLNKILGAQAPESAKRSKDGSFCHDEMLFIITHQTYELWFKQILFELDSIRQLFARGPAEMDVSLFVASHRLERILRIQQVLVAQVAVIETMTPLDFLEFRELLTPASGFQSYQFRLVENKLGLDPERTFKNKPVYVHLHPEHQDIVKKSTEDRPLLAHVDEWLSRMPFLEMGEYKFWREYQNAAIRMLDRDRTTITNNPLLHPDQRAQELRDLDTTLESFRSIFDENVHNELVRQGRRRLSHRATLAALLIHLYREEPMLQLPFKFLTQLAEMDENFSLWRYRHLVMAQRMIGTKIGTGGSAGSAYLQRTVRSDAYRVFHDIENLSTYLLPLSERPALPAHIQTMLRFAPLPPTTTTSTSTTSTSTTATTTSNAAAAAAK